MKPCPKCGIQHPLYDPCEKVKPPQKEKGDQHASRKSNSPTTNKVDHDPGPKSNDHKTTREKETESKRAWRARNPDKYREYQREYMRKRRAGKV